MALIEIELLKAQFEALVGVVARSRAVAPVPILGPIGQDRLIREVANGANQPTCPL